MSMVITYVMDMLGLKNNGTTVTALRSADSLRKLGNEVRFICFVPKNADCNMSAFKILKTDWQSVGPFDNLVFANGMTLAKLHPEDYPKVKDFLKGTDVVHLFLPFAMENHVRHIATGMGIAVTSAMHLQPENVSYNISSLTGHSKAVNSLIYYLFRKWTYRFTRNIHTPSEMMKDQMAAHHYKNDIFAISNGVDSKFHPVPAEKPEELRDKYVITMVGRLSGEKRQDLIIKAVGHSRFNGKIQLIFCGQGPKKKKYERLSRKYLLNPAIFAFRQQDELLKVLNYADLYIHASDAESEAIACIEAFSCGKVPVISDSPVSATNHFALDGRCLFKAGDYKSLMERIEYFYLHPEVVKELEPKYAEYGQTFALEGCVLKLEAMFEKAVQENEHEKKHGKAFHMTKKEAKKIRKDSLLAGIKDPYIPLEEEK